MYLNTLRLRAIVASIVVGTFADARVASAQSCVPTPPNLISWWPGDGNANDIINGNPGTLQNGATFAAGFVTSGNGEAFSFDGVDDFVEIPSTPELQITGSITIDAWIKVDLGFTTQGRQIVDKQGGLTDRSYAFQVVGSTAAPLPDVVDFFFSEDGSFDPDNCIGGTTNVVDGQWHHVAATFDSATKEMRVYVDGSLDASKIAEDSSIHVNSQNVIIGRFGGFAANPFPGLIDEVEIYNRALSSAEIQAIFLAGSAGKCKTIDTDGDGIPDDEDACPDSELSLTVVIDGCDSGVENMLFDDGCTMADLIAECADGASNHGGFVSCVAELTNEWKQQGIISGQEKGAIQSCAAQADIP